MSGRTLSKNRFLFLALFFLFLYLRSVAHRLSPGVVSTCLPVPTRAVPGLYLLNLLLYQFLPSPARLNQTYFSLSNMPGLRDKFDDNVRREGRLDTPDTEHFPFRNSPLPPSAYTQYPQDFDHHYHQNSSISPVTMTPPQAPAVPEKAPPTPPKPYDDDFLPPETPPKDLDRSRSNKYAGYYNQREINHTTAPHAPYTRVNNGSDSSYEMLTLNSNPFGDNATPASSTARNPFEPIDTSPITYDHYPAQNTRDDDMDMAAKMSGKHLRRQERNRRKQDARLPWYHYTRLPWFTIIVTTIQVVVFIVELAKMSIYTGSAFQTKPYFNPMLGPSTFLLISMGARYVPCMHRIDNITLDLLIQFPCPNSTSTDTDVCNLAELCSLGGIPILNNEYAPHQWYRVITPIFLHAGFLHIIFNLLLQITMGWSVEKAIGWLKYSIIYLASGVAGFLLGANFSPNGIASTGASGALFGIIATNLLLFVYCGKKNTNIYNTKHYRLFIIIMVFEIIILFVLGLLPGLDNFSHIGGFCMGLLLSLVFLKDPSFVYNEGIYTYDADATPWQLFIENWNPMNRWNDKIQWKVLVWVGVRVLSLTLAILFFALLFVNLYSKRMESEKPTCSWCKYLSCIPVNGWCDQGEVTVETITTGDSGSSSSSAPTMTATPNATTNTPTTTSATSTTAYPGSIDNPNLKRELHFSTFSTSQRGPETIGPQHNQHHETSLVLLALMAILSYRFIRRLYK